MALRTDEPQLPHFRKVEYQLSLHQDLPLRLAHRARAALRALSVRCSGLSFAARALPPSLAKNPNTARTSAALDFFRLVLIGMMIHHACQVGKRFCYGLLPFAPRLAGQPAQALALLGAVIAYRALGHGVADEYVVLRSGLFFRATRELRRSAVTRRVDMALPVRGVLFGRCHERSRPTSEPVCPRTGGRHNAFSAGLPAVGRALLRQLRDGPQGKRRAPLPSRPRTSSGLE